ncbi:TetR/AcrR family transcriptional regulator [Mycolicibacterium arabiense]|uniref:TetR/AcrR family transcriptional regulator n=1 Tax=Mycolicibacterium arabiense TaxID=1286181 RepID=UPI0013CF5FD8|nr:TetR family transcriptional regulator [Mycolicibacterium arabiense]MCV7371153.1 TetR/AcrR family transcriptional regulator [Mycolicibacterium arabiense]
MASPAKTKRGRRQGEPVSRDAVLAAAKERFAHDGYEKTTLRAIAKDARVDPSMVLYLFGSKADLFKESLRLNIDPTLLASAMAGAEGTIGERLVKQYFTIWEAPETASTMATMLQSATSNSDANEAFRTFMRNYVLTAVSGVIGGDEQARLRAMLAATSLVGTALMRYVMKVPPLATLPADDLARLLSPTVTRYLVADADELGLPSLDELEAVNALVQHHDTDHHQDDRHQ